MDENERQRTTCNNIEIAELVLKSVLIISLSGFYFQSFYI
jgi:hypothetical protein